MLSHVYTVAVALNDKHAQYAVVDAIIERYLQLHSSTGKRLLPEHGLIRYIYNHSATLTPLRRFFVDIYVWEADPEKLKTKPALPTEFIMDVAQTALKLLSEGKEVGTLPGQIKRCDYHGHSKGEVCTAKKRKRQEL